MCHIAADTLRVRHSDPLTIPILLLHLPLHPPQPPWFFVFRFSFFIFHFSFSFSLLRRCRKSFLFLFFYNISYLPSGALVWFLSTDTHWRPHLHLHISYYLSWRFTDYGKRPPLLPSQDRSSFERKKRTKYHNTVSEAKLYCRDQSHSLAVGGRKEERKQEEKKRVVQITKCHSHKYVFREITVYEVEMEGSGRGREGKLVGTDRLLLLKLKP